MRFGSLDAAVNGAEVLREIMRRTGHTAAGQRLWSDAEIDFLRTIYPDYRALERALPDRSRKAIEGKVRALGICAPRATWTDGELRRLKARYRAGVPIREIAAELPGRTPDNIWARASRSGWSRPKKPPTPSPFAIYNKVRLRAFELNLTMRDLDAMTKGKGYFGSPAKHLSAAKVGRAIEVLGGRAVVRWRSAPDISTRN